MSWVAGLGWPRVKKLTDPRHQDGYRAESRVCWYLRRRGWRIVARNWHGGGGELDIVACRWRTLLVAEVRYRRRGKPLLSIDRTKIEHLLRASRALVRAHHLQAYRLRLDLCGVDGRGRIVRHRDILR